MKLFAISDLHVGFPDNRRALAGMSPHPEDWLVLGGDLGETEEELTFVIRTLASRFSRLIWVPGNHELWTMPHTNMARGQEKYLRLVDLCRRYDVVTPEDPYLIWPGAGGRCLIAPLFLLYDYSFCPDSIPPEQALAWALAAGVECADEHLLHSDPYPSKAAWCEERCRTTEARLAAAVEQHDCPSVLVNHFPLLRELAVLPRIPRFSIWCGTRRTRDWHTRFRAQVVVYGHLHMPRRQIIDGVRFEEVSFGYPRQRCPTLPIDNYLRQILPMSAPSRW
jgi:3',5'-cyclic AMP phosphodiesterase CpdA